MKLLLVKRLIRTVITLLKALSKLTSNNIDDKIVREAERLLDHINVLTGK